MVPGQGRDGGVATVEGSAGRGEHHGISGARSTLRADERWFPAKYRKGVLARQAFRTARSGRPSAPRGPDRQAADSPARPVVTVPPETTYPNLRHPIASFVFVVLAVILVGVGLLAVTGNGALSVPRVHLADCAPPNSPLLRTPGAQFTADFPAGPRTALLGPAANDFCFYGFSEDDGDHARPLGFGVTANLWTGA